MEHYNYQDEFKRLYNRAVSLYGEGNHDKASYFSEEDQAFLKANGWRIQDFYDYAEDMIQGEQPSYEIAQSIEQVRRDYFLHIQKSQASSHRITVEELPAKSDSIQGIEWLPRILPKARAKIKGELPEEIMYCCGGDRKFLKTHDIHPAEFLRVVWANMDDDQGIIDFVQQRSPAAATEGVA